MNFRTEDDVVHRKYFRLIKESAIIKENKKFTLDINLNNATLECNPTKTHLEWYIITGFAICSCGMFLWK